MKLKKELLTKKYGKPNWENINWIDDFYKNIRGNWRLTVARGDLKYVTSWENPITTVTNKNYQRKIIRLTYLLHIIVIN